MKRKLFCFIMVILAILLILLLVLITNNEKKDDNFRYVDDLREHNLTLTIYYVNPYLLTRHSWSVSDLIENCERMIVVEEDSLKNDIDLSSLLNQVTLKPVENESSLNARIYYVIEDEMGNQLIDVAMWGTNKSIYVNGIEVYENPAFYDLIKPYLPDDINFVFEEYLQ